MSLSYPRPFFCHNSPSPLCLSPFLLSLFFTFPSSVTIPCLLPVSLPTSLVPLPPPVPSSVTIPLLLPSSPVPLHPPPPSPVSSSVTIPLLPPIRFLFPCNPLPPSLLLSQFSFSSPSPPHSPVPLLPLSLLFWHHRRIEAASGILPLSKYFSHA